MSVFVSDLEALSATDSGVIVLQNETDHVRADALYREGRRLAKAIKADSRYVKAQQQKNALILGMKSVLDRVSTTRLVPALTAYRRAQEDTARKAAQEEATRLEVAEKVAQEAAAATLREEAKGRRGKLRKELLEEARTVEQTPLPSPESAVSRILAEQRRETAQAGFTPTTARYHAEVDSLFDLVAQIVASDPTLLTAAIKLEKSPCVLQQVPLEALVGIRREKGELAASPYLNSLARAQGRVMQVCGVRAVRVEGVANR